MLLATFFFPSMNAAAKALSERYAPTQIAWARYVGQCALLLIIFAPRLASVARTERLGSQLLRSGFLLGATFFLFVALSGLAIPDATAIMFAAPLIVTALAGKLLGERVGVWRWSAVAIGFGGMLLILRPGGGAASLYGLAAVTAAASYALYQISTRWVAARERVVTTFFYSAVVGAVALSCAVPFVWRAPSLPDLGLMAATSLFGALGQLCFVLAFRAAPASILAPINYMGLLWASLYSVLFFGAPPDRTTLLGAGVVILAGLVILWRERVRGPGAG